MSLEELDRRCYEARERRIAPLRRAEIEKCRQDKRSDPGYCERFYKDYGEGGRTLHGTQRPRMFDDLPECVEALNERNTRNRGTRGKQRQRIVVRIDDMTLCTKLHLCSGRQLGV